MIHIKFRDFTLACATHLPEAHGRFIGHARLVDQFDLHSAEGEFCFVAAGMGDEPPRLVVEQRYSPTGFGFEPGLLFVEETGVLFVGAGQRLLAYDLAQPRRLWVDTAAEGFWSWDRHGDVVLMSAELELAAWSIEGQKRWSRFVEPPWNYTLEGGTVAVDVMGTVTMIHLATGAEIRDPGQDLIGRRSAQ